MKLINENISEKILNFDKSFKLLEIILCHE